MSLSIQLERVIIIQIKHLISVVSCTLRGYDLSSLRARQLSTQDFLEFDLILAMDHQNFDDIHDMLQSAVSQFGTHQIRAKVALMSEHDPQYLQQALPDPYYGGADGFERVLDQCESSSLAWVNILNN